MRAFDMHGCPVAGGHGLRRRLGAAALVFGAVGWAALGCSSHQPHSDPIVSIAPAQATLQADLGTEQFVATVQNDANQNVIWRVNGILGGNALYGTISPKGLYSAPTAMPNPPQVTVTAVSVADSRDTASATVTITAAVTVAVAPATAAVGEHGVVQFTAVVGNAVNTGVNWSVNGTPGGSASVGTISSNGLYTAPAIFPGLGQVTVTATSVQDPHTSAAATVTLTSGILVAVSPAAVTLQLGASQAFTATVSGTANGAVSWSVDGQPGGSGTVGVITAQGVYTAPAGMPPAATVAVTATSLADPAASGSATVTLQVAPNTFNLSPASTTLSLPKAASATIAMQITTGAGFTGTINLAALGLPPNVTATFDHNGLTASGTVQLTLSTASISLAAQSVPITVTATASGGASPNTQTAAVLLTIQGWSGAVHTLAGGPGGIGFEDGAGEQDEATPLAIASDGAGNIYFTDGEGFALRQLGLTSGAVTTLIGSPYLFTFADGEGLALDRRTATFYVADARDNQVLAYTQGDHAARVLAGSGAAAFLDGAGKGASFNGPRGLALSPDRTTLYVADTENDVIRSIDVASGAVTTLAGQPGVARAIDGKGSAAAFCRPWGLDVDPAGANLYIADTCSFTLRRLRLSDDTVTTIAGSGHAGTADGPALAAEFSGLSGLAVDPEHAGANGGRLLYVCDGDRIRVVTLGPGALVYTLAGQVRPGESDGSGGEASFFNPRGIAVMTELVGNNTSSLFIADSSNGLIRRLDFGNPLTATSDSTANTGVSTIAGQPSHRGLADGAGTGADFSGASVAMFDGPTGIATDGVTAWVADSNNAAIRAVDLATSTVSTAAGPGFGSADGPAAQARFNEPEGLALASAQRVLYVADTGNNEIRKLDLTAQVVTTLAGATSAGFSDGALDAARFNAPQGVALSSDGGKLYVADSGNNAIRVVDLEAGTVSTLAGGGAAGSRDGTGAAARFNDPTGLALDGTGKILFVGDYGNHTIRSIALATGAVVTIAGEVGVCGHGDGFGGGATLCNPGLLASDGRTLFWGDSTTGLVRCLNLATGQVETLAGAPGVLHMADGTYVEVPGTLTGPVRYNVSFGVAVAPDASFLLFADRTANVVRIVK